MPAGVGVVLLEEVVGVVDVVDAFVESVVDGSVVDDSVVDVVDEVPVVVPAVVIGDPPGTVGLSLAT